MRTSLLLVPFAALLATSAHAAGPEAGRFSLSPVSYTHLTLPTTPYV